MTTTITTSTVLAMVLVATAAVVIGGLIAIPVIEAADAANKRLITEPSEH